jgi:RND family efflux transporter MFP subunit
MALQFLAVLMVGGGTLLAVSSTHSTVKPAAVAPRPPSVTVVQATYGPIVGTIHVTGTLVPRDEVLVSPEIDSHRIVELLADEGDAVFRGRVLARLSHESLDAQLAQINASVDRATATIAQATSQVAEAKATQDQAESAFARTRKLRGSGFASQEILEQRQESALVSAARVASAVQALRMATADKELAEARQREMQINIARTEIKAPASGIIIKRNAQVGALASQNGEPLFRILRDGVIELETEVPETALARLRVGQSATIRLTGRAADVPAQVRLIVPEVNRTTRLGRVRLTLDPTPDLIIGTFALGIIDVNRQKGVLVPASAVLHEAGGPMVQVVNNGIIETRPVVLGLQADGKVEIRKGLEAGDIVVALSGTFVHNGDRVTPVAASSSPDQAGLH